MFTWKMRFSYLPQSYGSLGENFFVIHVNHIIATFWFLLCWQILVNCSYWFNTTNFVTFLEVTIVRCSRKYLFRQYGRKIGAEFLEMREAAINFQVFSVLITSYLRQVFQRHSEICIFFVMRFNM